jgi:chromosome segregation ATPase
MLRSLLVVIVSAVALTACVSNDPRKGGFFGGLSGINSGAYDARIQQRGEELNRQEHINQSLQDQSKALDTEAQAWEAEVASEHERLDEMNDNLSNLESDVNDLKAKSIQQKTDIVALQRKIATQKVKMKSQQGALKALEKAGGKSADPERYRVLQQERNRLVEEYKRLLKFSQTLSDATK